MKKKYLIVILAIVLCFTLVGCGKKETTEEDEPKENIPELRTASNENYEVLLKGHFGFDAKEIEEMGFTLKEALGTEAGEKIGKYISPDFMIVYYEVSPEILSKTNYSYNMREMFFNCESLTSIDVSKFNTELVGNMQQTNRTSCLQGWFLKMNQRSSTMLCTKSIKGWESGYKSVSTKRHLP